MPSSKITIRPVRGLSEAETCARIMPSSEPCVTLRRSYQHAIKSLTTPAREILVALVDDTLSGFIVINMGGPFAGYIQSICVFPDCRDQGVGRALLKFAEKR